MANKLRWALQLHHTAVIFTALYYQLLMDGYADIASLRWYETMNQILCFCVSCFVFWSGCTSNLFSGSFCITKH